MSTVEDPYAGADELGLMRGFPPPPDKRVDRSNALMRPPFNRWAYQHMRTVFPSAPVRTGEAAALEVSETQPSAAELGFEDAILCLEVGDHLLLVTLHPAGDRGEQELEDHHLTSGWKQ